MATQWAPLISNQLDGADVTNDAFPSRKEAVSQARKAVAAQPGTEYELMVRTGQGEWRSFAGNLTVQEVIDVRWSNS